MGSTSVVDFLKHTMDKDTPEKDKIRSRTLSFIHEFFLAKKQKKVRFLTMPGIMWYFEKALRMKFYSWSKFRIRAIITGVEINYKVFAMSAAKMPGNHRELKTYYSDKLNHYVALNNKEQVYLLNMDIFDLIENHSDDNRASFNIIWLDTTHTVISIARKLKGIEKVLATNVIVILTVLKGRENVKLTTTRSSFVSALLEKSGLKLVHEWEYFDTSPMLHLIYTKEQPLGNLDQIIA